METAGSVILVEDDPAVRAAVVSYLRQHAFEVTAHSNGISAERELRERTPDLLIVDRMLPGLSGDELTRAVRERSNLPILMLTALADVEHRVEGLELGVDDYLAKPFSLRELTLRAQALIRRAQGGSVAAAGFSSGDFRVDPAHRRVWVGAGEILLTGREYELLHFLMTHPDEPLTRDRLLRDAWGWRFGEASTVTVHVRRLREKIEPDPADPRYLRTEWGVGYRFTPSGVAA